MINYCEHHKRTFNNGNIISSRCIKLNKDVEWNGSDCIDCDLISEELPEQALNQNEKPMSRKELFEALSSTLGIIAEQMEEFDKRINNIEEAIKNIEEAIKIN